MAKTPERLVSSGWRAAGCPAGQDEALGVEGDAAIRQPVGVGLGADEQEQMADLPRHFGAVAAASVTVSSRPLLPSRRGDLGARVTTSTLARPEIRSIK